MDEVTDAVLAASRALVGVAARSLAAVSDEVTLPQFRALVVLSQRSGTPGSLAIELGVHASTGTRLVDRLESKGLVQRAPAPQSRREVELTLTDDGRQVVEAVLGSRRRQIAAIVARIPAAQREAIVTALGTFADAAGELPEGTPEPAWSLGWMADGVDRPTGGA